MRPCMRKATVCDLMKARSCATFKGKVECIFVKARPCATFEGKVMCYLKVAHVGSSYAGCVRGVGLNRVKRVGLDMMLSAMWNTCEVQSFKLFETRHTCRACEFACF